MDVTTDMPALTQFK